MDDSPKQGLSKKELAFCEAYCNYGCSGIDAIYEAGYKPRDKKTAYSMSSENLRKLKIRAKINEIFKNFQFLDEEVLHEHWYLIKQMHDLPSKTKAIDMFYKKNGMYKPENYPQLVVARKYENLSDAEIEAEMEKGFRLWAKEKGYKVI